MRRETNGFRSCQEEGRIGFSAFQSAGKEGLLEACANAQQLFKECGPVMLLGGREITLQPMRPKLINSSQ
jgi:hypothetical protein